jgi:predicted small metal-binding protein
VGKTGPDRAAKSGAERRANRELREVLDELVEHVRHVARNIRTMPRHDIEEAEERLVWLADEVWRSATEVRETGPTSSS